MDIETVHQGEKTVLHINGKIDTQTAPDFQNFVDDLIISGDKNLEFDFKDVEYISSAGLRAILYSQKRIDGIEGANLTIKNVNDVVMEVLEMTGFTDFLNIIS